MIAKYLPLIQYFALFFFKINFAFLNVAKIDDSAVNVAFDFNNHRNVGRPFRGLLIVNLAQAIPTGTTDTLPIVFTSGGGNPQPVTGKNGEALTVADIEGTGVYLMWYESQTNTLQLIA
jgi:hypothetical protein